MSDLEVEQEPPYPEEQADEEVETDTQEIPQEAPLVDFNYNNKAQKAYRKHGFKIPDDVDRYERRFLEDVDTRNGPIKRRVYKVLRCRALDPKTEKMAEYLYYVERWDGKDYLGNDLDPVAEHVEGKYEEVQVHYTVNQRGKPRKSEPQIRGKKWVYYIPFKKSTLDKILKDVEKDSVEYYVKIGDQKGDQRRDNTFSYDQFANWSYAKCIEASWQPGGPRATPYVPETKK